MPRHTSKLDLFFTALLVICGKASQSSARYVEPVTCYSAIDRQGDYSFSQSESFDPTATCLMIVKAPSNLRVELRIQPIGTPCGEEPELAFIDGLNLNNDFFPGVDDHPVDGSNRMRVLCGDRAFAFVANQNVASILHRFVAHKRGFIVNVRFLSNPAPCNIIAPVPNATETFTLTNSGLRQNCTLLVLYPTQFSILKADVGHSRCRPKSADYFEIRSGMSVDPLKDTLSSIDSCALFTERRLTGARGPLTANSPCYASFVRLVSSGRSRNTLVVRHGPMNLKKADEQCRVQ